MGGIGGRGEGGVWGGVGEDIVFVGTLFGSGSGWDAVAWERRDWDAATVTHADNASRQPASQPASVTVLSCYCVIALLACYIAPLRLSALCSPPERHGPSLVLSGCT